MCVKCLDVVSLQERAKNQTNFMYLIYFCTSFLYVFTLDKSTTKSCKDGFQYPFMEGG